MKQLPPLHRIFLPALFALLVAACGDSTDTQTAPNLVYDIDNPRPYTGPVEATADVTAFRQYLWNNISGDDRCGQCHGAGQQSPSFVRYDDINLAYEAALTVVDLANPENSRLVQRVASGHNCWSDDTDVCAEVMTTYIRNWALATLGGPASSVTLVAPPAHVPGATKTFPPSSLLFSTTVYPVLTEYCSRCHAPDAGNPQAPFFASSDVDAAYAAARNAIDLNDPSNSRFVQRLRDEFHNCWSDCPDNATEMRDAIALMTAGITLAPIDPGLLVSGALGLREGIVASSGGRFEANVIAKYEFKEGSGTITHDTSGVSPALDLTLSGATEWVGGWGIRLNGGKAQGSTLNSRKLYDQLTRSGEYTIEAWVAPANVTQEGPARIVSYSGGSDVRNFMLGQSMYNYDFHNRNDATDGDGAPALSTADAAERLQATLQHVVVTYTPSTGRRIYVNGEYTGDLDPAGAGTLSAWNNSFALVLGSEVDGSNVFRGVMRLLAIHKTALKDSEILGNFKAGVGERFYLMFDVSTLVDSPQTYVLFDGSQFDSYSYLFTSPRLVSLNPDFVPDGLPLAGMRIGINGREVGVGQAYTPLDLVLDSSTWLPGSGDELSRVGTVIPVENGPDFDQFFLTFERIGAFQHLVTEAIPAVPADPVGDTVSDIGLRTFASINASLSDITTVPQTDAAVAAMYERVKQQLPASDQIGGFSSAHQIGITQLAIEYCSALVDDPFGGTLYFAGLSLDAPYTTALDDPGERNALIYPLIEHVANSSLLTMPDVVDIENELNALADRLVLSCTGSCAADPVGRTKTIAKAVCTAAAGNAAMLIE